MIINLQILAVLQIATALAPTYSSFIGVRALFGIAIGGIWGLSAAMALENMPIEARGLFSGVLQQGYSIGYLIAAVMNTAVKPNSSVGYRSIFYIGAGLTALVGIIRVFFPESKQYRQERVSREVSARQKIAYFVKDARIASKQDWKMFLYCVLLMTAFNWMSHGSQEIYVTYLRVQKQFSDRDASIATIIGQCGAVVGGAICGYYSQFFGGRLTVMVATCFGACMIPLWTLPTSWAPIANSRVVGKIFFSAQIYWRLEEGSRAVDTDCLFTPSTLPMNSNQTKQSFALRLPVKHLIVHSGRH